MRNILWLAAILLAVQPALADQSPISMGPGGYSVNFDVMGTGTSLPTGWGLYRDLGATNPHEKYQTAPPTAAQMASDFLYHTNQTLLFSTEGAGYGSFGKTGDQAYNVKYTTDVDHRAAAVSPTACAGFAFDIILQNDTGSPLSKIDINAGYRFLDTEGRPNAADELCGMWAYYLAPGGVWTRLDALDSSHPTSKPTLGSTESPTASIEFATPLGVGEQVRVRWFDDNTAGNSPDYIHGLTNVSVSPTAVPEPSTIVLAAAGLLALCGLTWRNRRAG